ncbi:capsule biosynthesis protein [Acinetobacter larvae]|uniref:Capsular biosynthesis protein n=1 Tax=Acinetobacter larvae TaxID=1789224 RepID=A0A1B2M223_9GAMM|nr:capsular biosynthesis protein [Acinetobacter larvae]AOA59201.1 hypothetical protein BFG52_13110 [Acinetobacter larvae]
MSVHLDELLSSKKVLLLQGPMGDYFNQLAQWLEQHQIETFKVNFNGGDWWFHHQCQNAYNFRGRVGDFNLWLQDFINAHQIDALLCFGDCRKYHRIAREVSLKLGIGFFACEEGYIRPNYITFEQDGVNFFSNFKQYLAAQAETGEARPAVHYDVVHNSYRKMLCCAFVYYLMWILASWYFPHYKHHRGMRPDQELYYWLISGYRRLKNYFLEPRRFQGFLQQHAKQYFVFALQVHNDFQIRVHSDLKKMESYIEKVIRSFSDYADAEHHLVLKHHPMDRGYRNYAVLIQRCAAQYGISGRVHYFCDIHLPTLLKNSRGMVTINSTTGIQALYHEIPVKVLGRALYDLPRLTCQHALDQFWMQPTAVDAGYFHFFRYSLIEYSQLNGAYYGLSPWMQRYDRQVIMSQKPCFLNNINNKSAS